MFIGIVRRQAIIRYCYDKARAEQQHMSKPEKKPERKREAAAVH